MKLFKYKQSGRRIVLKLKRDLLPSEVKHLKRWLRVLQRKS